MIIMTLDIRPLIRLTFFGLIKAIIMFKFINVFQRWFKRYIIGFLALLMLLFVSCKRQWISDIDGVYVLRNYNDDTYPIHQKDTLYIHNDSLLSSSFFGQQIPFDCREKDKKIIVHPTHDASYNLNIQLLFPNKIRIMVNYDNNLYYEKIKN